MRQEGVTERIRQGSNSLEAIYSGQVGKGDDGEGMIEDVIREMFEEWAAFHKFKLEKDKKVTDDYGVIYANPMTQGAWMAWNGAMDVAGS